MQAVDPRGDHVRQQRLDKAAGVHDDGQPQRMREVNGALVIRRDQLAVHFGRHERLFLEAHVLIEPDAVGLSLFCKKDFHQRDHQVCIGIRHVADPVGVERHTHEQIDVTDQRMDGLKDVDAAPHKKTPVAFRRLLCGAVAVKMNPPLIGV